MNIKLSNSEVVEIKKLLDLDVLKLIKNVNKEVLTNIKNRIDGTSSVKLYVDGASNLHAKIAGIGGVFYRNGTELYTFSEFIGAATNNEAEYSALIKGLNESLRLNLLNIVIYADSELVVKQINGEYKVKNKRMQKLYGEAQALLNRFEAWTITHIPREKNSAADGLSKEGMRKNK